ncbi:hypothetical protein [Photobacterium leiognathi]|uniref:hypothetical protein n=1 Tax=Photobacterium leiognathi TaxID=553611 RepID=UPI002980B570|nr:hypothetical protein [Photobacterium leiognathi]
MDYIELNNPTGLKLKKWERTICISDEGVIFVPSSISTRSEGEILHSASFDGVAIHTYLNHAFFPLPWISDEFPETKEYCDLIEKKLAVNHK